MDSASSIAIGTAFYGAFAVAAAWPFYSLYLLARHFMRGTPLPSTGIYGFYVGGFPWVLVLFVPAALHDPIKAFIGIPLFAAGALTFVWNRRMAPPRGMLASAGDLCVLVFCGLMAYVVFGGGYFDRLVQIPHAQSRLKHKHVPVDDPAALARALDDEDPYVKWGAVIALRRLETGSEPVRDALTKALACGDARASWEASLALGSGTPSPAVFGPLLDSPDPETRARAEKGLDSLGRDGREAALAAVARWRTDRR